MAASTCAAAMVANAADIPGLYSTGLNDFGAGLAGGAVDTHYTFQSGGTATGSTCGTSMCGHVALAAAFPIPPWIPADTSPNPGSNWLTPSANQGDSYDPTSNGTYKWTLTFDLKGYVAATASFSGLFAADNGATVQLNDGGPILGTATGFDAWSGFSSAGATFNAGINTLVFTVTNLARDGGNPTGLRVQFTESSVTPVPEPEAYGLAIAGLGLVAFGLRRRRPTR